MRKVSGYCGRVIRVASNPLAYPTHSLIIHVSNLGKILIKSVAAKRVAAMLVAARAIPENSCFQTSSD
jgi:hypothetical protein